MSFCTQHTERPVAWVCLEVACAQRVMCNVCAVKLHERAHRVEEYDTLKNNGFIAAFYNSEDEFFRQLNSTLEAGSQQKTTPGSTVGADGSAPDSQQQQENDLSAAAPSAIEESLKFVVDAFQESLRAMLLSFSALQDNIAASISALREQQKQKKLEAAARVKDLQAQLTALEGQAQDNIEAEDEDEESAQAKNRTVLETELIDDALTIIYEELLTESDGKTLEVRNWERKKELLAQLRSYFLQLTKQHLENVFTRELCSLFEMKVATLAKEQNPSIQNGTKFIDFLEQKWKQDYEVIQKAIALSAERLDQVLKYTQNGHAAQQANSHPSPQAHLQAPVQLRFPGSSPYKTVTGAPLPQQHLSPTHQWVPQQQQRQQHLPGESPVLTLQAHPYAHAHPHPPTHQHAHPHHFLGSPENQQLQPAAVQRIVYSQATAEPEREASPITQIRKR